MPTSIHTRLLINGLPPGSWRFEEVAHGQTRVGFRYNLRARPWWLAWLLTPILGWVFARDTRKRLLALKTAVEKGGVLR